MQPATKLNAQEIMQGSNFYKENVKTTVINRFSKMQPNWERVQITKDSSQLVYEVELTNPDQLFISATEVTLSNAKAFAARNLIRLLIFKEAATGKILSGCYMSIMSDDQNERINSFSYKKMSGFNGKVMYYHLDGSISNGWIYKSGNVIASISKSETQAPNKVLNKSLSANRNEVSGKTMNKQILDPDCITVSFPYYNYACAGVEGYEKCGWMVAGYDQVTTCYNPVGEGGSSGSSGGSGSAASNNIPDDPYMPGQDHVAIDPKKYTKCFESIPNAGATYKVIVQVQEPVPGTSFNWAPANGVGHTAITLVKQGSNGMKVTQTLGFYPAGNKISGPSKMVDNSDQTDYTIRMEINMGSNFTDFNKILSGIESPPPTYQLFGMNCTAFVVGVCSMGGITLPNAITTVGPSGPGGATMAMTPGGLGSAMRAAHAQGDSRVASGPSSTGNNPASNGSCN